MLAKSKITKKLLEDLFAELVIIDFGTENDRIFEIVTLFWEKKFQKKITKMSFFINYCYHMISGIKSSRILIR